jgi:hypothetical protein
LVAFTNIGAKGIIHLIKLFLNIKNGKMKKKIITVLTAFVLITSALFANGDINEIPVRVSDAFHQSFSQARDIRWENLGNYYKVTFREMSKTMFVFYSDEADLMGTAMNTLSDKLPDALQTGLKTWLQNYWITDLAKYQVADNVGFLVTLENADKKIVLKTVNNQPWQIYSKESKEIQ